MFRVCWEPPSHVPQKGKDARGTFDNHGQINDAVSLQPIHTPDLLIYINNDLIKDRLSYGSVLLCTMAGLSEHDILLRCIGMRECDDKI